MGCLYSKAQEDSTADICSEDDGNNESSDIQFDVAQLDYDSEDDAQLVYEEPLSGSYMRRVLCETKVAGARSIDNFTRNNNFRIQLPFEPNSNMDEEYVDKAIKQNEEGMISTNLDTFKTLSANNGCRIGNEVQHLIDEKSAIIDGVVFKERTEKTLDFHKPCNPEGMLIQRKQIGDQIYEVTEFLKDGMITKTHVTTEMTEEEVTLFRLAWKGKWETPDKKTNVCAATLNGHESEGNTKIEMLEEAMRQSKQSIKREPEQMLRLKEYDYGEQSPYVDEASLNWILEDTYEDDSPLGHQLKASFAGEEHRNY